MSPSRRRRCRVDLPPKDADVETLLNVVRGSQLQSAANFHDVKGSSQVPDVSIAKGMKSTPEL